MNIPNAGDIRIAILAGGSSSERAISLVSGTQVSQALASAGYQCDLVDTGDVAAALHALMDGGYDIAFLALHGAGGEDGTIQGLCELIGIPYTGSGVLASALAMDKGRAKAVYQRAGIPVAPSVTLERGRAVDLDAIVATVGEKCVVKPIGNGSSVGMSIVHASDELPGALELAFSCGQDVMVEAFVEGAEVTVGVLGNDEPFALPVIQIVPHAEFYDFEQKYAANGADHVVPAPLDQDVYALVQAQAVAAHKALGCAGMSRSDFIVTPDGKPVILETNTIPGMTPTSLLPDAARHAGYDFATLCAMIMGYALELRG